MYCLGDHSLYVLECTLLNISEILLDSSVVDLSWRKTTSFLQMIVLTDSIYGSTIIKLNFPATHFQDYQAELVLFVPTNLHRLPRAFACLNH